jgi:branched-chain amino acid transport system ATP-binding protein
LLKVENITTGYGKKMVVSDVSFEINDNELVLLRGGNGSGKSTLLKCIYGLLKPWNAEGKISFNGKNMVGIPTSEMIKSGIVYIPQKNNYFEELTVDENLTISGTIYNSNKSKERKANVYNLIKELYNIRKRTPFNLSGGERQLLAFGIALIHEPKLILFDEPFAGLDGMNTDLINNLIISMKNSGVSMLIIEHKNLHTLFKDKEIQMYLGKLKSI